MNKRTLIIPDLHLKWFDAERIISKVPHDEIIFLGDYFDDFNDTPEATIDMCDWLNNSVKKPNRIHLFGNHDIHYAYPYASFRCSGYEQWKKFIVQDNITNGTWSKLKFYHVLDNKWLLSHAGLHKSHIPKDILSKKNMPEIFYSELSNFLDVEVINGLRKAGNNESSWILNAGRGRGGQFPVGGIVWCDFNTEFKPTVGLNQIIGHTPQSNGDPKWNIIENNKNKTFFDSKSDWQASNEIVSNTKNSINIDIDCWQNLAYALWDGEKLVVDNCLKKL